MSEMCQDSMKIPIKLWHDSKKFPQAMWYPNMCQDWYRYEISKVKPCWIEYDLVAYFPYVTIWLWFWDA